MVLYQLINRIDIDAVQSEDYIEGTYKGVGYRQADIKGIDIGKSELDDPSTRFCGRISVYDFKKNLDGDVIVKSKKYSLADVKNMKKVEMENISFNQKFDVYSMNEHMVYYFLTPQCCCIGGGNLVCRHHEWVKSCRTVICLKQRIIRKMMWR